MTAHHLLSDTPYSLPPEADSALAEMRGRLRKARADLRGALREAERMGLVREMDRAHGYWTVFESNSIEFEGPDLSGTVRAIESDRGQNVLRDLNVTLLPELLREDKEAFAAIGLETARVLALRYIGPGNFGVSSSDLRGLHSVVAAGEWFAGVYRNRNVKIAHGDHMPPPTYEIAMKVQGLADWTQRDTDPDDAVLRAAVGHAWLTHIHPFKDGNGRVARLFTNVLLGQNGLPPAIVKAKSQRSQYIGALAHSDEGGDIMPLTGLFLDTVERYVAELHDPRTFQKLFDDLVTRRGNSYFDWYTSCVDEFMDALAKELALNKLELRRLDGLSPEVFSELRQTRNSGLPSHRGVMAALVIDREREQELALYYTRSTNLSRRHLSPDEYVPTLGFALPNEAWQLHPYRRTKRGEVVGLGGLWVQPDKTVQVHLDEARLVRRHTVKSGASRVADHLSTAFAQRFDYSGNPFPSARWLPKLQGGPG